MGFFLIFAALAGGPAGGGQDIAVVRGAEGAAVEPEGAPDTYRLDADASYEEAATLYIKGLEAWKAGAHGRAWRLATEALVLEPSLTPARLLAGYALLRLRRKDEGVATLAGLALEPDTSPLSEEARRDTLRVLRVHTAPYRRDQWWVAVGNITFIERNGDTAQPLNGYVFAGQAPLLGKLALRVDGGTPWGGIAEALDVRGPRFDVMAVAEQRVDGGRWHVDFAAGPAFWIAEGRYWPDGWEPYFGARAAIGVDVRLGTVIGLRYEMGASVFPTAADALPFYAEPLDMRIALQTWFGK